jgi:hypothetical protein
MGFCSKGDMIRQKLDCKIYAKFYFSFKFLDTCLTHTKLLKSIDE